MDNTAKPRPPVNHPRPVAPKPVRPTRPSFTTTLVSTLATTRARAKTLLGDGYTLREDDDTSGRFLITKPDRKRTVHHVDLWWDAAECRYGYTCSCWLFQKMVQAQRWDAAIEPECKHGLCLVELLTPARALVLHVEAAPRSIQSRARESRYAAQAQSRAATWPAPNRNRHDADSVDSADSAISARQIGVAPNQAGRRGGDVR